MVMRIKFADLISLRHRAIIENSPNYLNGIFSVSFFAQSFDVLKVICIPNTKRHKIICIH